MSPMIYLDEASTAFPKAPGVAEAMSLAVQDCASPGRGAHGPAIAGARLLYKLREAAAATFNAADSGRFVLMPGATWALNAVLRGYLKSGDQVLCSSMEHNAVSRTLAALRQRGVSSRCLAGDASGRIEPGEFAATTEQSTTLWVVNHGGNVNGVLQDLAGIASAAAEAGIPLLVDCAQSAGNVEIDLSHPGIKFAAFAGHKGLRGPMGSGLLYVAPGEELESYCTGGTGGDSSNQAMPVEYPEHMEAGTSNLPGAAGLHAALISSNAAQRAQRLSAALTATRRLSEGLSAMGVEALWAGDLPVLSVMAREGEDPSHIAQMLSMNKPPIAVRSGLHCAPWAHERLGTLRSGTVRLSPAAEISDRELESVLAALEQLIGTR